MGPAPFLIIMNSEQVTAKLPMFSPDNKLQSNDTQMYY